MNFNSLIDELRNFKWQKINSPLWIPMLYEKLKPVFDMFIKEATDYFVEVKSYGLFNAEE